MNETSEIQLISTCLKRNISFIKDQLNPHTELGAVVKGNAYGHGIEPFVQLLLSQGITCFAVYSTDEARRVKSVITDACRLIIMGDVQQDALGWCIRENVEFYVFNFSRLHAAIQAAEQLQKQAKIHIELETGMYRTGFDESEFPDLFQVLKSSRNDLFLAGLCTHFAGAELNENLPRIKHQAEVFQEFIQVFRANNLIPQTIHACCSAAMIRVPNMQFDLVRVGILLYGFWPSKEMAIEYTALHPEKPNPLKRVIQWSSQVMSIKHVPAGSWIGYGENFSSQTPMQIALVPVGYTHGYARSLSNVGQVLIQGKKLPVLGLVNMNCISVDATQLSDLSIGDEVILIGKQGEQEVSVASFGERSEQLNYELLTRLPHSIPRTLN